MNNLNDLCYSGLDVHKKTITYVIKTNEGKLVRQGSVAATRPALTAWAAAIDRPWIGALEATMFSGWVYDELRPRARRLDVAHPLMLQAITCSKKKNDRLDADKICGLLRCDLLPRCYMAPTEIRELRARTAQPRDGGAQAGGLFVGGRSTPARLRSAAAGGLKEEGFSLGDPPPGKAVLAVSGRPPPSQGERRAAAPGKTARGSLPWEEEKDVLLSDDELPAGPRIRRDCATEHYVPEAPSVTVSRPAGRTLTESSARAGGSLLARGSSWMSGPWGPTFDSQTLAAQRDYRSHPTRHRRRSEGSLRRPLDFYLSWMSLDRPRSPRSPRSPSISLR